MKNLLLLVSLLCISVSQSFSQDSKTVVYKKFSYTEKSGEIFVLNIPFERDKVVFSKVYDMDGYDADQIYSRARIALTYIFKSAKDVIQLEDPSNKLLIAQQGWAWWTKPRTKSTITKFKVYFSMKIECRDNRYKITLYDFKSLTEFRSPYQNFDIVVYENEALNKGLNEHGELNMKNIYGFSFIAWNDIANQMMDNIYDQIIITDANSSNDW